MAHPYHYDANAAWTADYAVPTQVRPAWYNTWRPNALMVSLAVAVIAIGGSTVSIASNFGHIPDVGADGTPGQAVGYMASQDIAGEPQGPNQLLVTLEPPVYAQGAVNVAPAAVPLKGQATFSQQELASMAAGEDAATQTDTDNARHIDTAEDAAVEATDGTVADEDDSTAAMTVDTDPRN